MRKILSLVIIMMTFVGFTSCESDPDFADPNYKGTYCYVVPCLQWNASIDEVRAYMKKLKGWNASTSQIGDYYLQYKQAKTHNDIFYTFHGGKLKRVTITWYSCQDEFANMCQEYANNMGFTWGEYNEVFQNCTAISHELHCDISAQLGELNDVRQMSITFDYAKSY